jgi:hypothetical protein
MKTIIVTMLLGMTLGQRICSQSASNTGAQSPPLQEARIPGIIDYSDDRSKDVLTAPSVARAGEDFQMTINTFGSGCERGGDTEIIAWESGANVIVYDFTAATRPGIVCTTILKRLPHTITMRFMQPGEALIRVWGRRVGADTPPFGIPLVLEHRVMVGAIDTSNKGQGPDPAAPSSQWMVTETGIGPIRIGMTVAEVRQALGSNLIAMGPISFCYYVKPERGPSGVLFMIADDRIVRVDVSNPSIATTLGARVGDNEGQIKALYSQVVVSPRKTTSGHYLTAMPAGNYRIVFETDGSRVTRYWAGRMPEVSWVEGCT